MRLLHLGLPATKARGQAASNPSNSAAYTVIARKPNGACKEHRQVIAGGETVLDAVSQLYGLSQLEGKKIWVVRVTPNNGGAEQILNVDWDAILTGKSTVTNYQVHSGDRIWIVPSEPVSAISRFVNAFSRFWEPQPTCVRKMNRGYNNTRNNDDL